MTKAEMEEHWRQYLSCVKQAQKAASQANFSRAVAHAEASWEHIDGMLRHANTRDGEGTNELHGISLVLRYAPMLFDYEVLSRLEQFLAGKRRITKSSASDLNADLAEARAVMLRARVVWDELERQRDWPADALRQKFSGSAEEWRHMIDTWKLSNAILTFSIKGSMLFSLATRMDDPIVAKCPNCGRPDRRTKSESLAPGRCQYCRRDGIFVHVGDAQRVGG